MTLEQLVQSNSWLSISAILLELYSDEEKSLEGYEEVFEKLLMMAPEETDMTIEIKTVKDDFDGEEYVDVSGKYKHPKNEAQSSSYAIEFTSWKEWLGMDICNESLKEFTELEILAHCLYEMTFAGFEEEEIQEQIDSIKKTAEDYEMMSEEEKLKNATSFEELLDKLEDDDQEKDRS
ncbi:DUF6557 family protein [Christiangramia forsetii]|uniref:Uncharacterized protein n=2 Tax=Christiangramia forsetii TaxID=411153 RepID=A0M4I0_CHRFK|nr:DUF6557 family protein [Christiangramia forsetii]GGG23425.1 hypothetical protein GCM10011532_03170 [Christiangramia forsetii]CAL67525.1 hypothetical protein GFO_2569 [Christiangramia forsetii KT0803]